MRLIKKIKDVKGIKSGEQWVFDGYPEPPETYQKADSFAKDFQTAQELKKKIEDAISEEIKLKRYTQKELEEMKKAEVVGIANSMGIQASTKDGKADTIQKIIDNQ